MLIYIVEDEERIRELESYALEKNDFEVMSFENSEDFYKALEDRTPDLILLDIMLPGDDGLTILENLRNNGAYENIPVIIISAKDTELDRVKGLDLGADDYLCKPFGVMEMVSRVRARLRGITKSTYGQMTFEKLTISEKTRDVTVDGKTVVCGHWHCSYGHSRYEQKCSEFGPDADSTPYRAPGIIALDAYTAHSGKVNVIVLED